MINLTGYQVTDLLYKGIRTEVYRGIRESDRSWAIVKVLRNSHPNFNELVQFRNQYIITQNLQHRAIVVPFALERYGNGYALIMPDDGAIALPEYWQRSDHSLTEFLTIAIQLADALQYLNRERIIHKDIKPGNILIHPKTRQVQLIDFSISSLLPLEQQQLINPKVLQGTLAYISPEQTGRMNRGIDYRTDFYSLGVTFYELLTGELPFNSDDPMELVHCHLAKMPRLGNGERGTGNGQEETNQDQIPQMLADIVLKLMAKNAEDRYQSALGLKYDLEICLEQLETTGEITSFEIGKRDLCDRFIIPEKLYGREQEVSQLLAAFDRVANPPKSPLAKGGLEVGNPPESLLGFDRVANPPKSPLTKGGLEEFANPSSPSSPSPPSSPSSPHRWRPHTLHPSLSEMMLVAGFSGIGKTAVINEVHKPIVRQRGYFINGKFDQFNLNIPFSAFVLAFRKLMGQLLGESDASLAAWTEKILQALGENAQVIVDVIPELEELIGKQPPVQELSGSAAQNRFNLLFKKFIGVFTTKEHPLVMFLDDLQWADSASLNLLKLLMDDSEAGYLLILGAYRDNEVFPTHPLILTLEEMKKQGATLNTLTLAPLGQSEITDLVADTLHCTTKQASPLAKLLYQKTQGNPFFTTQFLKGLHEENCITFNADAGSWQCDMVQIYQLSLTSDVVEFMMGRLQKLSTKTQNMMKLSACIGNEFNLETLAIISEQNLEETAVNLWSALGEGLILPESESYKVYLDDSPSYLNLQASSTVYKFLHDRVQQAAYNLISEDDKQATHLKIGTLLLDKLSESDREERIFEIVNHFNIGKKLIADAAQKRTLIQLNLSAGRKAKASTAYAGALSYIETGMELLSDACWKDDYEIAFALHKERAEVEHLNGHFEAAEMWIERALGNVKTPMQKVAFYNIAIVQNTLQANYTEAIDAGRQALALMGIELPENDFEAVRDAELEMATNTLQGRSFSDLMELPVMDQPEKQMAIKLLITLGPPTYRSHQRLWSVICAKAVNLCLNYGNTPEVGYIYPAFGGLRGYALNNYQGTDELLNVAIQLTQAFNNKSAESVAYLMIGSSLRHWSHPLKVATEDYLSSYRVGLESSNLQYAAYAFGHNMYCRFYQSVRLEELLAEVGESLAFGRKSKNQWAIDLFLGGQAIFAQLARTSLDSPQQLASIDESDYLEQCRLHKNWQVICIYNILKTQLLFLLERFDEALECGRQAEAEIINVAPQGLLPYPRHIFIYSLLLASLYSQASESQKVEYSKKVWAYQKQLDIWAHNCPGNFLHLSCLVKAESDRISGDFLEAIEMYDRAIQSAKENDYLQEEALGNELAAKFYLNWGKEKIAATYMQESYYCYARWGAKAKTDLLEEKYPQLLTPILQPSEAFLAKSQEMSRQTIGTVTRMSSMLDLASVIKASQTISAKISLDTFLTKLIEIIVENACANKGMLILENSGSWEISAWCDRDRCDRSSTLLEQTNSLPKSIINTVKRTQKTILLNQLEEETSFAADPYLIKQTPQCLLCTPILRSGKLIGILYLENHVTAGAFTEERIETIDLLSAQAAISIENVRLYGRLEQQNQTLEAQVEQRTLELLEKNQSLQDTLLELQRTQAQLIQTEKMSSLGQMVAGMAHEINNPINFIAGNIIHAREYIQDLLDLIDLYENNSPSDEIEEKLDEIELDYVREDLGRLFNSMQNGSDRIRQIILGLRNFSRLDEADSKQVDIHQGLENTLMIVQHRLKPEGENPEISLVKKYGQLPLLQCYPSQLNQVFLQIITNAIDVLSNRSASKNPQIAIATEMKDSQTVRISIGDNGPGMSENIRQKVFDPFFTTKPVGQGMGLGLSTSYQIITEQHGGHLHCISQPGVGTEFIIDIPVER